jgi:hypothetical protein
MRDSLAIAAIILSILAIIFSIYANFEKGEYKYSLITSKRGNTPRIHRINKDTGEVVFIDDINHTYIIVKADTKRRKQEDRLIAVDITKRKIKKKDEANEKLSLVDQARQQLMEKEKPPSIFDQARERLRQEEESKGRLFK